MIFVNLPVRDLDASKAFYERIGCRIDPKFTDENAACVVFSETIHAMLLVEPFFARFTDKRIVDARVAVQVLNCLALDDRAAVDRMVDAALIAGGSEPRPAMDSGFMYMRGFDDLDGHGWEISWMDPEFAARGIADPRHVENPPQP
jgi:predicted lactoylglutathione lyase